MDVDLESDPVLESLCQLLKRLLRTTLAGIHLQAAVGCCSQLCSRWIFLGEGQGP